MYCRKCGNQMPDDTVFCSKCGSSLKNVDMANTTQQTSYQNNTSNSVEFITPHTIPTSTTTLAEPYQPQPRKNTGAHGSAKGFLVTACVTAAILSIFFLLLYIMIRNIIYTDPEMIEYFYGYDTLILIFLFVFLISFIISLSMTIHYFHATKEGVPVGTAYKICTLIFVSLIAGIIMLSDKEE